MADMYKKIRKTWLKGMVAVGTAASKVASSSRHKVNEMTLESKRHEIIADFCLIAYDLWQKGTSLPQPLHDLLLELAQVDEALNTLHAERLANMPAKKNIVKEDTEPGANDQAMFDDNTEATTLNSDSVDKPE